MGRRPQVAMSRRVTLIISRAARLMTEAAQVVEKPLSTRLLNGAAALRRLLPPTSPPPT